MLNAMESTIRKSANKAAAKHGVPPSTLKDWLSGCVKHGTKPYLNQQEEKELTDHLILSAQAGFGKTRRDVMNIEERYINIQNPSSNVSISNGWWFKFKKRNHFLGLRSGDSTAGVRMNAVNEENVNHYFDRLQEIFDLNNFAAHPEAIYNMDETGMPLEPHPPKVVTKKGHKKVRY